MTIIMRQKLLLLRRIIAENYLARQQKKNRVLKGLLSTFSLFKLSEVATSFQRGAITQRDTTALTDMLIVKGYA